MSDPLIVRAASDLVLPVDRVAVVLRLVDGSRRDAQVFVAAGDDVRDLLESSVSFLPAREGDRIRLYARTALMCVSVPVEPSVGASPSDQPAPYECAAAVHLIGGETITGTLRYVAPRERRRPADFLNEDSRIFALHGDRHVHYIAKVHVTCVEELGPC